ncbi:MAG: ABC transporter permease, partial [Abitibacteriaceae bacterium]|nr:ABC transporter permease [Abditibacteriaceae bacterium]
VYTAIAAASFIFVFAIWCALSYGWVRVPQSLSSDGSGHVSNLILPTPTGVLAATHDLWQDGSLWGDTKISVYRIVMGFLLSAALAIPLGILIGAYKTVEAAQEPLIGFIRYVPVPALIPLVMVVAGLDEAAKILLIFIGTYFQMVIIVADVTRKVPRDLLSAARTLGADRRQLLFNVLLPATLPGLMDTCRTMIGWAWTYLVIAEVVATNSGLGFRIMVGQRHLRTEEIYVGIIVLGLLGLCTDMLFKLASPRLLPWAEVQRQ